MKKESLSVIFTVITSILSIPLIAMQFTDQVNWSLFDFLAMAILLSILGLALRYIWQKATNKRSKLLLSIPIILFFLLVWIELAVGLLGSPMAGS